MSIFRRIRGIIGTAATWCVGFTGVGTAITVVALAVLKVSGVGGPVPTSQLLAEGLAAIARWAMLGAGSGAAFASVILLAGESRTMSRISSGRFASWGFLAGAVGSGIVAVGVVATLKLPLGVALPFLMIGASALIGGGLGSALARATLRAVRGDAALSAAASPAQLETRARAP